MYNYLNKKILIEFMARKQLSKSDIKDLLSNNKILEKFIDKKSNVVLENNFLFINNKPLFFYHENKLIPSLKILLEGASILPKVVVDKGAIKFVVNGADIMRPGIVRCDEFTNNSIVVIIDETYGKPLAIGLVSLNSEELMKEKEGKVIKNIHYIGDEIWEKIK